MANKIQIKRSVANATVTGLSNGELAFTQAGNTLHIGLPDGSGTLRIGGAMVPGTLTANQALVANATGFINEIRVANAVIDKIYANGSHGSAGGILSVDGSGEIFWASSVTADPAGSNTQIQFNDSEILGASDGFTFNRTSNTLFVGNTVLLGATSNNQLVNLSNTSLEVRGGWNANSGSLNLIGGSFTDSKYAKINLDGNSKTATIEADATVAKTISGSTLTTTNSSAFTVATSLVIAGNGASITSVNAATVGGNTASDLNTYADNKAANAYSNAMSDTLSRNGSYTGNNSFGGTNTVFTSNVTISGTINRSPTITLGGDLTGSITLTDLQGGTLTANIAANSVELGTDTTGDYVANVATGVGLSGTGTGEGSTPTIAVVANSGIVANTSGVFVDAKSGLVANSSGLFVNANTGVVANSSGVFIGQPVATTDNVTFNDIVINGNAALGSSSADIVSINGLVNTNIIPSANVTYSLGNTTNRWNDLYLSGSTIYLGNATISEVGDGGVSVGNVTITTLANLASLVVTGNTKLGDSFGADVVSFVSTVNTEITPSINTTYDLGRIDLRWNQIFSNTINTTAAYISGDLQVGGNVYVTGNVTSLNVQTLAITDSLIQLAVNNEVSDLIDIGFYGHYSDDSGTTKRHTGLFRDASQAGVYRLFTNLVQADLDSGSGAVINTAAASYAIATLNSYLDTGAFVSNSTSVSIVANSSVNVNITANTLSLSSPLLGNSGGTGLSSYTNEDILVANSTNGFRKLGLGTAGYVLQSNGSALVYDTLDGGVF